MQTCLVRLYTADGVTIERSPPILRGCETSILLEPLEDRNVRVTSLIFRR